LNARHHEIVGLTPDLEVRLAASILGSHERRIVRISSHELRELGAELCRNEPEIKKHLIGEWALLLGDLAVEE
jgi:hypothetical protein